MNPTPTHTHHSTSPVVRLQKLNPLELNTLVISFILATSPDCPGAIYQRSKWKNSFVPLKEMSLCNYILHACMILQKDPRFCQLILPSVWILHILKHFLTVSPFLPLRRSSRNAIIDFQTFHQQRSDYSPVCLSEWFVPNVSQHFAVESVFVPFKVSYSFSSVVEIYLLNICTLIFGQSKVIKDPIPVPFGCLWDSSNRQANPLKCWRQGL